MPVERWGHQNCNPDKKYCESEGQTAHDAFSPVRRQRKKGRFHDRPGLGGIVAFVLGRWVKGKCKGRRVMVGGVAEVVAGGVTGRVVVGGGSPRVAALRR